MESHPMERVVLASLAAPLLAVDKEGVVTWANEAAAHFWRSTPQGLAGQPVHRLFGGNTLVADSVTRAWQEEQPIQVDAMPLFQAEGMDPVLLRIHFFPLIRPNGPPEGTLLLFWDETARENREADKHSRQLADTVGNMVARLAHELQNPLSGIKGATQLLARQTSQDSAIREFPQVILRELDRLERLVKNLLSQGGEPPLTKSRFNLHELLDTVIWFVRNSAPGQRVERIYDPSLPELYADRDRMHQVFLNLMKNGLEAAAPGMPLTVGTAFAAPWEARARLPGPRRNFLRVDVMDRGPGVAAKDMPRLFTPFFTTRKQGNGLGLSLCQLIVRAHQGHVLYAPRHGGGAVFSVYLPILTPEEMEGK
ncbi:MAG: ATP-binding protein [Deltaproteobacteria bacterium]|nr:ATP-binding protein [Deltaproteobacteria bacterium]